MTRQRGYRVPGTGYARPGAGAGHTPYPVRGTRETAVVASRAR